MAISTESLEQVKEQHNGSNNFEEKLETSIMSGKRKRLIAHTDSSVLKKLRRNSESLMTLFNLSHNSSFTNESNSNVSNTLIKFMHQLDLSILCLLRKYVYIQKYPSMSLSFGDNDIDRFNNIFLCCKNKSVYVQIVNVGGYCTDNAISYARLFAKEKRTFSLNDYFDSYVRYIISKSCNLLNDIKYLVIYTNSGLDLTEDKKLRKGRFKNFYAFKLDSIDVEDCDVLKDFLFTNNNAQERGFYQFSQDKTSIEELSNRLEFSPATCKAMQEKELSQTFEKEIKKTFLEKLVFAVNQPGREELNAIVKRELKKNSQILDNYTDLQNRVLQDLIAPSVRKKFDNTVSTIICETNLLMFLLHAMYLHKSMLSVNFEQKTNGTSNDITINYRDRITYLKAHASNNRIGYSLLFPVKRLEKKSAFSINQQFSLFVKESIKDIRYFIIYSKADLDLTNEKELKKGQSKEFYPLKFDSIDIQKKKYKLLRDCLCINKNGLYRFSNEEKTQEKLFDLLQLPPSLQKEKEEGRFSSECEREIKGKFLKVLIFAVNQTSEKNMNTIVRDEIERNDNVPYNYGELCEIMLRWIESYEFDEITREIMERLLEDIKNNRSSSQEIEDKDTEKIKFAKSVVGNDGTPAFYQFLGFVTRGKGKKYLEVLKRNEIYLESMSTILSKAGSYAVKAFEGLYNLWFDVEGNKTRYLNSLEKEQINLASMSGILNGAGVNAPATFKDLHDFWFNEEGHKTQYLKVLETEGVDLVTMSSILNGAGVSAPVVFEHLYYLWFDNKGNKTPHLMRLQEKGINLSTISSILEGAGAYAAAAFKDLCNVWFDEEGNEVQYLKTLEKEEMSLVNMSSILNGAGIKASATFLNLYDTWFDSQGNKTQCLRTLEREGISLSNISNILCRAGSHATKTFKELYNQFFDAEGNKTRNLKCLEDEGMNLTNVSSILQGAGANGVKAFKELYSTIFDEQGNKRQNLTHSIGKEGEKYSFTMNDLASILKGAGATPKVAFDKLHSVCFNAEGKRSELLNDFCNAGFKASHLSRMLCGAGIHASSILKRFHNVCFNDEGEKTKLLNDFYEAGFTPSNFCNLLSGAVDSIEKFHYFCFSTETKKYINRFLGEQDDFTLKNLCNILHGARDNICSALKDFYDVCFNEAGNRSQVLNDFYKAGFKPSNLCHILSSAGNNAAFVLKSFHNCCFNKGERLNRFLVEGKLLTPKDLSKILHGQVTNTCSTFEKLYSLCFDDAGNKTEYLNRLKENDPNDIPDILLKKLRKFSSKRFNNTT